MKTMLGLAVVAVPVAMELTGYGSAGLVTLATVVGGVCWIISGWFTE